MSSNVPRIIFLTLFGLLLPFSCRRDEDSALKRVPYSIGTLYLDGDADPKVTGGVVQYRIYKTGDIFYNGEISYYSGQILSEVQIPFSGQAKFKPEDVLFENYKTRRTVAKVQFSPESSLVEGAELTVSAAVIDPFKVDSPDATGTVTLRSQDGLVEIVSADIAGTINPATAYPIPLHLKLSAVKP